MNISKRDALQWFEFFSQLDGEELMPRQQELALATLYQIDAAEEARVAKLMAEVPGLKSLEGRTYYVGPDEKFPKGCRSCLLGTGLGAVRVTNRCNLQCPFCYDFGEMDLQPPVGEGAFEIGGTIRFTTWSSTTLKNIWLFDIPRTCPASYCPISIDCMPPLYISEK